MDAPPPPKRRRTTPPPPPLPGDGDDTESTDYKLTLLLSLYPELPLSTLLTALIDASGDVSLASTQLAGPISSSSITTTTTCSTSRQTSLSTFLSPHTSQAPPKPPKKGTTLHLYTPAEVAALTPTTLQHNFLPATLATKLLRELLSEAETFGPPPEFHLFSRTVRSPHTNCLFLRDGPTQSQSQSQSQSQHQYQYQYHYQYQGRAVPARLFTPSMHQATQLVEMAVEKAVRERCDRLGRRPWGVSGRPWTVNAAFVNRYKGAAQSVGYHTDELTYLGPMPVIASLSLGVEREFRVRRVVREEEPDPNPSSSFSSSSFANLSSASSKRKSDSNNTAAKNEQDPKQGVEREGAGEAEVAEGEGEGAVGIYLPHNSLLIMHAGMQEGWKHSIHPARRLDLHPIASDSRINITYRHYRPSLHPDSTPRCRCRLPATLRPRLGRDADYTGPRVYYWACSAGYRVGSEGRGCGLWREAEFDRFGEPLERRRWDGADMASESMGEGKGEGVEEKEESGEGEVEGKEEAEVEEEGESARSKYFRPESSNTTSLQEVPL